MHRYAPILHEDGLETAILGLDMEITPQTFYDGEKYSSIQETSDHIAASSPSIGHDKSIKLLLQCKSEVKTKDRERNRQKTHAQKSAIHTSLGYMFLSGR